MWDSIGSADLAEITPLTVLTAFWSSCLGTIIFMRVLPAGLLYNFCLFYTSLFMFKTSLSNSRSGGYLDNWILTCIFRGDLE